MADGVMTRNRAILLLGALFFGCAGPFTEYYHDQTGGIDVTRSSLVLLLPAEPALLRGGDPLKDRDAMLADGYALVGYSAFNAGAVDLGRAGVQARKVHAAVVLIYSRYTETLSGVAPLSAPQTQTTSTSFYENIGGHAVLSGKTLTTSNGVRTEQVPFTAKRYDYLATYWVMLRPPGLGAVVQDLTPEARRRTGEEKGVLVLAVLKDSPALRAGIYSGDILKEIDGAEIVDKEGYQRAIHRNAGRLVQVVFSRGGQEIRKAAQLDEIPAGEEGRFPDRRTPGDLEERTDRDVQNLCSQDPGSVACKRGGSKIIE